MPRGLRPSWLWLVHAPHAPSDPVSRYFRARFPRASHGHRDLNLLIDLNTRVDNLENNVGLPSIPNLRDTTFLNAKVENVEKADTIVPHYDKSYTYYVLLHDKHEVDAENEH